MPCSSTCWFQENSVALGNSLDGNSSLRKAQFRLCINGAFLLTEKFRLVMFFCFPHDSTSCRCLSAGLSRLSLFSSSFCRFVDSFHLLCQRQPRPRLFEMQNQAHSGPKISQRFDGGVAQSLTELRVRCAAMSQDNGWEEGKQISRK